MVSILRIKTQLETLRDELEQSLGNPMADWLYGDEKPEDLAAVAAVMADVGSKLAMNVASFLGSWDFKEDCRRDREKQAAEAGAAGAGA